MTAPFVVFFYLLFALFTQVSAAPPASEARIISLVPSNTELLFALGFGSSLVGISDFCNTPGQTASITKVGGMELNLERIAGLHPTLIIDLNRMHKRYELIFRQMSLRYLNIEINRLEEIPSAAVRLSEELGSPDKGVSFCGEWASEFSRLTSNVQNTRPRVYIEIWDAPLQAAARESFIGQMVRLAGGENVIVDSTSGFPVVADEDVIKANPQIILLAYPIDDVSRIRNRPGWSDIDAIRKNRVYKIDHDILVRPGPRALAGVSALSNIIKN